MPFFNAHRPPRECVIRKSALGLVGFLLAASLVKFKSVVVLLKVSNSPCSLCQKRGDMPHPWMKLIVDDVLNLNCMLLFLGLIGYKIHII